MAGSKLLLLEDAWNYARRTRGNRRRIWIEQVSFAGKPALSLYTLKKRLDGRERGPFFGALGAEF